MRRDRNTVECARVGGHCVAAGTMEKARIRGCNRQDTSDLPVGFEDVLDDGLPQGQKSRTSSLEF